MAKQIETRLSRLEGLVPVDDPLGVASLSDQELQLILHQVRVAMISDPETSEGERELVRQALAAQEEEAVRAQLAFVRRPDIAGAIASNRAAGVVEYKDRSTVDWEALAAPHAGTRPTW